MNDRMDQFGQLLRVSAFCYVSNDANRVPGQNRSRKPQSVESVREVLRVHLHLPREADCRTEDQRTVGPHAVDAVTTAREFSVHRRRMEVAADACEVDYVRLSYGAPVAFKAITDGVLFEVAIRHGPSPWHR